MSLTSQDVERVALLARLALSDAEVATMTSQMGQILKYFEQLQQLDTRQIEPMAHAIPITNVFTEDAVRPSLPRESALQNAPKHDDECFRVPAVLGE